MRSSQRLGFFVFICCAGFGSVVYGAEGPPPPSAPQQKPEGVPLVPPHRPPHPYYPPKYPVPAQAHLHKHHDPHPGQNKGSNIMEIKAAPPPPPLTQIENEPKLDPEPIVKVESPVQGNEVEVPTDPIVDGESKEPEEPTDGTDDEAEGDEVDDESPDDPEEDENEEETVSTEEPAVPKGEAPVPNNVNEVPEPILVESSIQSALAPKEETSNIQIQPTEPTPLIHDGTTIHPDDYTPVTTNNVDIRPTPSVSVEFKTVEASQQPQPIAPQADAAEHSSSNSQINDIVNNNLENKPQQESNYPNPPSVELFQEHDNESDIVIPNPTYSPAPFENSNQVEQESNHDSLASAPPQSEPQIESETGKQISTPSSSSNEEEVPKSVEVEASSPVEPEVVPDTLGGWLSGAANLFGSPTPTPSETEENEEKLREPESTVIEQDPQSEQESLVPSSVSPLEDLSTKINILHENEPASGIVKDSEPESHSQAHESKEPYNSNSAVIEESNTGADSFSDFQQQLEETNVSNIAEEPAVPEPNPNHLNQSPVDSQTENVPQSHIDLNTQDILIPDWDNQLQQQSESVLVIPKPEQEIVRQEEPKILDPIQEKKEITRLTPEETDPNPIVEEEPKKMEEVSSNTIPPIFNYPNPNSEPHVHTHPDDHNHDHHHHNNHDHILNHEDSKNQASIIIVIKHLSATLISFLPEYLQDTILDVNDALVFTGIIALTLISVCVPYFFIETFLSVRPLKKRVTELNKTLWKVSTAYENQQEEYDAFKTKALAYDEDKKRIEKLEIELDLLKKIESKQKDQIRNLQKELKQSGRVASEVEKLVESTMDERNKAVDERNKLKTLVASLQSTLKETTEELESTQSHAANIQMDLELVNHTKENLESKVNVIEHEMNELKKKLLTEVELRRKAQSDYDDAIKDKKTVENELAEAKALCHKYEESVSSLNDEICQKENELLALRETLGEDSPLLEISEISAQLKVAEGQAKSLQSRVESLTLENASLTRDFTKTKETLETLQTEKDSAETRLKVLESYFKEKEEEHRILVEKYEMERNIRGKDKDELAIMIEEKNDEIRDLNNRLEQLKDEFEQTKLTHRNKIRAMEAKIHEDWLSLCQSERKAQESKKEAELLRQKLTAITKAKETDAIDGLSSMGDVPFSNFLDLDDVPLPIPDDTMPPMPSYFGLGGVDFEPPLPLDEDEDDEMDDDEALNSMQLQGGHGHRPGAEGEPLRPPPLGRLSPTSSDLMNDIVSPIMAGGGSGGLQRSHYGHGHPGPRDEYSDGSSSPQNNINNNWMSRNGNTGTHSSMSNRSGPPGRGGPGLNPGPLTSSPVSHYQQQQQHGINL